MQPNVQRSSSCASTDMLTGFLSSGYNTIIISSPLSCTQSLIRSIVCNSPEFKSRLLLHLDILHRCNLTCVSTVAGGQMKHFNKDLEGTFYFLMSRNPALAAGTTSSCVSPWILHISYSISFQVPAAVWWNSPSGPAQPDSTTGPTMHRTEDALLCQRFPVIGWLANPEEHTQMLFFTHIGC